jgi:branched-subunit amino acid permease
VKKVDYRATIISSCWFAVAIISVVYMWLFADKIGDILFGVFLPIGLLVLVAVIVTIVVSSNAKPEMKQET